MDHGIDDDDGGVGGGRGIDNASERLETTMEAARIWGRRRRLRRCDDGPEELVTMTKKSVEKYES